MASGWARELAERIWRAERNLQIAQRNLRYGTDDARIEYARALREMEQTHLLVEAICGERAEQPQPQFETASGAMA